MCSVILVCKKHRKTTFIPERTWSGVFGSTVRANPNYLSERGAGVLPACFYLFCHPTVVCHPTACQDFSNQIYWWTRYTKECAKHGVKKGRVVTAQVAEYMQGGQFFGLPFLVFHSCRPAARVVTKSNLMVGPGGF